MGKKCSICKKIKTLSCFSYLSGTKTGKVYHNSQCTECRTEYNRNKYYKGKKAKKAQVTETQRQCMHCLQMFQFKQCNGSYCKPCWKILFYNKTKAKEATRRYRENHKERWRALHRLHQYNRRKLIKLTSDGSVTDQVLKDILNLIVCYWCKESIKETNRTIEHIIELSNGGQHTKDNLTMACFKCNSSRKNRNNTHGT